MGSPTKPDDEVTSLSVEQPAALTSAGPTPPQSPTATKEERLRGKDRFSLDALRLPFITSLRKVSTATSTAKANVPDAKDTSPSSSSNGVEPFAVEPSVTSTASEDVQIASQPVDQVPMQEIINQHLLSPKELQPKRSALSSSAEASSRRASKTTSPHRVSFSPSTEEVADAREQALSFAALGQDAQGRNNPGIVGGEPHPSKAKPKPNFAKWHGLKSRSTSDLVSTTGRLSLDSTLTASSGASSSTLERFEDRAALPGAAAARRRLFRWDRKGIHHSGTSDKGRVAKVKVTKHQALAARHAKTLEQVINAGMGLHPVPPRISSALHQTSAGSPDALTRDGKKKKVPRAKPIPVVDRSQLKGLKSALLDVDLANNIISELRSMPVPLDALRSGLGKIVPDAQIGTAGDHGQERILTANLPDTALVGNGSKDDSEIRKRPGATLEALDAATPSRRPQMERKARSAAEEALRKITLQAEASATPQPAVVTARTSSLPSPAEEALPLPAATVSAPPAAAPAKTAAPASGVRPLKMVCLDCGEKEAHQRHAQHLEAAAIVTTQSTTASATEDNTGFNVTTIATGAAAALAGVGGLLSARSVSQNDAEATSEEKQTASGARPPLLKSMSVANLPTLQDGQRLMGSTPLQLLMDPVGTAAQNSGAFDVLANVSGAAIRATQDMDSIHPPLDRMAIFVHWWGFEITLPKASMAYLGTAHSVSGAFLSFLQTMAVGGGVPELLPFIKYISTFMEVEYKAIQAQDQGHGVCIAGTWFMPLALVPRPWDYPLDGPAATPSIK